MSPERPLYNKPTCRSVIVHVLFAVSGSPEPDPRDQDVLQVEAVDLRVAENTRRHHTDEYDITQGPSLSLIHI